MHNLWDNSTEHAKKPRHWIQVALCSHRGSGHRHRVPTVPYFVSFLQKREERQNALRGGVWFSRHNLLHAFRHLDPCLVKWRTYYLGLGVSGWWHTQQVWAPSPSTCCRNSVLCRVSSRQWVPWSLQNLGCRNSPQKHLHSFSRAVGSKWGARNSSVPAAEHSGMT